MYAKFAVSLVFLLLLLAVYAQDGSISIPAPYGSDSAGSEPASPPAQGSSSGSSVGSGGGSVSGRAIPPSDSQIEQEAPGQEEIAGENNTLEQEQNQEENAAAPSAVNPDAGKEKADESAKQLPAAGEAGVPSSPAAPQPQGDNFALYIAGAVVALAIIAFVAFRLLKK